jgi:MtN3 and saliva related transmembrane protein
VTAAVGLFAAALTTAAWLPQIWRTWQTRSAGDLSWGYLGVTGTGMASWFTYGLLAGDAAVVLTNVLTIALLFLLAVLKMNGDRRLGHDRDA